MCVGMTDTHTNTLTRMQHVHTYIVYRFTLPFSLLQGFECMVDLLNLQSEREEDPSAVRALLDASKALTRASLNVIEGAKVGRMAGVQHRTHQSSTLDPLHPRVSLAC